MSRYCRARLQSTCAGVKLDAPLAHDAAAVYDRRGGVTRIARPDGLTTCYGYDSVGRLTCEDWKEANGTSVHAFSYDYDLNGNRTSGSILGVATYWE